MTPAAPTRATRQELVSVQCLRGLAAMMVVVYHCFPQLARMGYEGNHFQSLSAGVDVFFIISGFIMLYSAHNAPRRGVGAFLRHRVIRIVPIYWLLTSVMVAVALAAPQVMSLTRFEPYHAALSYLMLPALHPVLNDYWPILIPGWTLNCEAFFYVIFACGLALLRDRHIGLALFTGIIITLLVLTPLFVPVTGIARFYTGSVLIEFVYGLAACLAYIAGWRISRSVGAVCMAVGFALLIRGDFHPFPDIRGLSYGLPALLIFVGAVFPRVSAAGPAMRLPRLLGDASYSIYLTNMIVMAVISITWRKLLGDTLPGNPAANTALFILFSVPACAAAGIIFYKLVEAPMTRWLKARGSVWSTSTALPSR